jgi:ADP-dependent NAD(P)H-hydrate dehydratase / NAD(P)H-hydrate epimerase
VACGAGNNDGDGSVAAAHLYSWGRYVTVTWLGSPERASANTCAAHTQALAAGVLFAKEPPAEFDFAIAPLLGIGLQTRDDALPDSPLAQHLALLCHTPAGVLSVDCPVA